MKQYVKERFLTSVSLLNIPTGFVTSGILFSAERSLVILISCISGALVARILGPAEYGVLSYLLGWMFILTIPAYVVHEYVLVALMTSHPQFKSDLQTMSLVTRIASACFTIGIFLFLSYFVFPLNQLALFSLLACSLIPRSFDILKCWFQATVNPMPVAKIQFISLTTGAALRILICIVNPILWLVVSSYLIESLLSAFLLLKTSLKHGLRLCIRQETTNLFFEQLRRSFPLLLSAACLAISARLDLFLIEQYFDFTLVGIYALSLFFIESLVGVFAGLNAGLQPHIYELFDAECQESKNTLKRIIFFMFYLAVLVAIILAVSSGTLISILFGTEYQNSAEVLRIHSILLPLHMLHIFGSNFYVQQNMSLALLANYFYTLILLVAFNMICIPYFGIIGAAYAAVVARFVDAFLLDLLHPNAKEIWRLKLSAIQGKL